MSETLPNSLTKTPVVDHSMSRTGQEWLVLFCASCGVEGGRVLKCDIPNKEEFAFWLCQKCFDTYGTVAGTTAIPDELFAQKVREAQLEREGRLLLENEIIEALQNSDHYLSRLVRDRGAFKASH